MYALPIPAPRPQPARLPVASHRVPPQLLEYFVISCKQSLGHLVGYVALITVVGCSPDANRPFDATTAPDVVAPSRMTRTASGVTVPPRSQDRIAPSVRDHALLFQIAKQNDGEVRVGLKNPGDARGIWRGEILLRPEERTAALARLAGLKGVEVGKADPTLPAYKLRIRSPEALAAIAGDSSVDYIVPTHVPASELQVHDTGCSVPTWGGPLYQMPNGMADQYSQAFKELHIDRAWSYANGSLVTIGSVDTGVNETTWPELIGMYGRLTVLQPNSGACTHGSRSVLIAAGPANGSGSVGVAFYANVITSDLGDAIVEVNPSGVAAYDAVHRLYLSGGIEAPKVWWTPQ